MNRTEDYDEIFEKYYNIDKLIEKASEHGFLYGYLLAIAIIATLYILAK